MRRRLIRVMMMAGGVVVALALALFIYARVRPGSIQEWIGSQFQDIANSYLNPRLSFTDLDYHYPLTVSLRNFRLTAPDPRQPGRTIDILACDRAVVSLAQIPSVGKPIVIQKIVLDRPLISAVAVEPRSPKFIGFSDLLRGGASDQEKSSGPSRKLSDVFQMQLVQLTDGKIVYDPRIPGTVPMKLDHIDTTLNITKAEEGWYKLDTDIARKPVFDLKLLGQLNIDSFSVRDADIQLAADLSAKKLDYLPPELQALLKQYHAKGTLTAKVTGSMPLTDPLSGRIEANLDVGGANIALNGLQIPVEDLHLDALFGGGKAQLSSLKIAALGGTADLFGDVWLDDRLDADMNLKIAGMMPEKLLANPAQMSAAPARVNLDFSIGAALKSVIGQAPPKPGEPLAKLGLRNLRIWADNPANSGQSIDVVACKNLDVAMSQPIISGKPIIIDHIILDHPSIAAVSIVPGTMQFAGVPNFPKSAAAPSEDSAPAVSNGSTQNPGDFVHIKSFQLIGAQIAYDPRIPGTVPMRLDDITTTLTLNSDNPDFYVLHTEVSRKPVFNLSVGGMVDVKNPGVQNLTLNLHADLTKNQLDFLPPQLQLIMRQTRALAKLNLQVAASVNAADPFKGKAQVAVEAQNLDLSQGKLHLPIDDFSLSASLKDGKIFQTTRITALNQVVDISGSTTLNSRLDTDATLKLKDVDIESLLGQLQPSRPASTTSTKLSGEFEIQSPVMVAMGAVPGNPGEPIARLNVHGLRLTADDPRAQDHPLDFLACDHIGASLSELPTPGNPVIIDQIDIEHPAIRAVAMQPGSSDFAGFSALQNLASPRPAAESSPATTEPASPPAVLSDIVRLGKLSVADASLYYDPRLDNTTAMFLDHISLQANADSQVGDRYRFSANIPSKPDLNLDIAGGLNVDTLLVHPLTLNLALQLNDDPRGYLPPQVQQLLQPYDLDAAMNVKVRGSVPLTDPTAADLNTDVLLDHVTATVGGYRIPLDHVRLPIRLKLPEVDFLDSSALGGPTLEALNGSANLTGVVMLDDRLDTSMDLGIDGMLLQSLMADKIAEPRKELIGEVHAKIKLVNAPVLTIVALATPPATQPSPAEPASTEPVSASSSPPTIDDLPAYWGSADIQLTHARLAGLELVQGMSNIAKSVFADLFVHKDKNKPEKIIPKETAKIACDFRKDHIAFSQIHYEGEVVEADGKGYVTLDQQINLNLTGGVIQKLGGMGSVGEWIKQASDSLLYYHVYGSFHDIKYEVKRGNGQPIVQGAKSVTKKGINEVDKGLNIGLKQTNNFFHKLFNKKQQNQNQDQNSNSGQNPTANPGDN